jgi:hypothetical protein
MNSMTKTCQHTVSPQDKKDVTEIELSTEI